MNILEYQFTQAYYPINDVGTILLGSNINLHFFDKNLLIFCTIWPFESIFDNNVNVMLQKVVVHKDTNITFDLALECRMYLYCGKNCIQNYIWYLIAVDRQMGLDSDNIELHLFYCRNRFA